MDKKEKVVEELEDVTGGSGSRYSPSGKSCFVSVRGHAGIVTEPFCAKFKVSCGEYEMCRNEGKEEY